MNNLPLYNSRIIKVFVEYLDKRYPKFNIKPALDHAGITIYQIEDEGHWFNQDQVDNFYEKLVDIIGNPNIAREAGRYSALSKAGAIIQQYAQGFITPAAAYKLMGKIYPVVSRACLVETKRIGKDKIEISVQPKPGVVEKPYQCDNRLGTFESVAKLFTNDFAKIEHPECIHRGDRQCRYIISWHQPRYRKWKRIRNYAAVLNAFLVSLFLIPGVSIRGIPILLSSLLLLYLILYSEYVEAKESKLELKSKGEMAVDLLGRINTSYNNALLIQEFGQAVSSMLDIEKLLNHTMEAFAKRLDFDRGIILLANEDRTRLVYKAGYGYEPDLQTLASNLSFHLDKPNSQGQFVLAFKKQRPFLINDTSEIEDVISERSLEFARAIGTRAFICVPIIYKGVSEGVLAVDNIQSKKPLSQSDLNLLMGIAPAIGTSINNARSYQKIRENEERFRALGENSPDIIYTLDAEGYITYINPAVTKFFTYNPSELIGTCLFDIIKGEDVAVLKKHIFRARDNRETIKDVTVTVIGGSGWEHPANLSGAPNFDAQGKLIGIVGNIKDLSELKKNFDTLQLTLESTIKAMSEIVESRDPYTAGHQRQVSEIACTIAEEMGLPLEKINGIRMAAMIHDIGKMYVPAEILSKPVSLSDLELSMIRSHPEVGYSIIKNIEFNAPVADIVYQHHERMDGSGYPRGLSASEILLESRIVAVADVVEAMSSHRPYRPALGIKAALDEISAHRGSLYDPDVVDACLKLFRIKKYSPRQDDKLLRHVTSYGTYL